MVGWLAHALQLSPGMRVYELGTGSGYQAAVLAELVGKPAAGERPRIVTTELIEQLAQTAGDTLRRQGYGHVRVLVGDGSKQPPSGPFDRILCTAALPEAPRHLLALLGNSGVLIAPIAVGEGKQRLRSFTLGPQRKVTVRDLGPVKFVPLREHVSTTSAGPRTKWRR